MPIKWWMSKLKVVYPYSGLFFSNKKKLHADTWIKLENVKWKKPVMKDHISYDSIYMKYSKLQNP